MDAFAAYAEHPHLQAAGTADQRCIHCGSGNGLSRALRCINLFDFGLHLINTVAFRDMSSPQLDLRIRVRRRRRTRRGTAVHALPSSCSATMESRAEKCVIHRTNANYTFTYNRSWRHIVSFRSEVSSSHTVSHVPQCIVFLFNISSTPCRSSIFLACLLISCGAVLWVTLYLARWFASWPLHPEICLRSSLTRFSRES